MVLPKERRKSRVSPPKVLSFTVLGKPTWRFSRSREGLGVLVPPTPWGVGRGRPLLGVRPTTGEGSQGLPRPPEPGPCEVRHDVLEPTETPEDDNRKKKKKLSPRTKHSKITELTYNLRFDECF